MKGFGLWSTNKKKEAGEASESAQPASLSSQQPQRKGLLSSLTTVFNAGTSQQPPKTMGIATSSGFIPQRQLTTTLAHTQTAEPPTTTNLKTSPTKVPSQKEQRAVTRQQKEAEVEQADVEAVAQP